MSMFEKENQLNDEQELMEEKQPSEPIKKKKMKMEE